VPPRTDCDQKPWCRAAQPTCMTDELLNLRSDYTAIGGNELTWEFYQHHADQRCLSTLYTR
jgi:hypothetical protein